MSFASAGIPGAKSGGLNTHFQMGFRRGLGQGCEPIIRSGMAASEEFDFLPSTPPLAVSHRESSVVVPFLSASLLIPASKIGIQKDYARSYKLTFRSTVRAPGIDVQLEEISKN